ncbi:WD repeat protein [Niveomyces insectorum RCEF 264]|uniref:WD repeat protein n=1 Tax=Niveomyces insectorum RCEF 264 TaxID=1081102 RepID=A0A167TCT6_9HYPO|nr:WD repeat protein [Niveomyces insectorum RCEF 264]
MAENNVFSSAVDSVPSSQEEVVRLLSSSPPRASQTLVQSGRKERRQPSITPRKFRRFFTPRSRVSAHPSAARRALRDLTARALNGSHTPLPLYDVGSPDAPNVPHALPPSSSRSAKRRKTGHFTPETSPLKCSASTCLLDVITPEPVAKKAPANSMLLSPLASSPLPPIDEPMSECDDDDDDDANDDDNNDVSDDAGSDVDASPPFVPPRQRIVPLMQRGFSGQLFQRQLGNMPGAGHRLVRRPVADWRVETADFYSASDDVHLCMSQETNGGRCIPFCAASCNTNEIVAVGDEEGRIRLLDSGSGDHSDFSNIHISFAAHGNAVIDLAFSDDDYLLATASGDQTGKVVDMLTQTPISILDHHTASLKQVRFQPGSGGGNVLATSSRDGSVKIWDLRCKGGPAQDFTVERTTTLQYGRPKKINQGCVVNCIYDAHARTTRQSRQVRQAMQAAAAAAATSDVAARWEVPGRAGEVSVTAIQFLPPGKEHLLLTACEADASIKLWDIRSVHTSRQKTGMPVSATAPPESHSQWRPFGMSSLSLNTDGSRLYGLCKDNTVYAYSTAHLVLGSAPELSAKGDHPKRRYGPPQEGLGPLYGFRHEHLHATSFYVKTAVRAAREGRPELLAVGSSDGCALLFPTDERYFANVNGSGSGSGSGSGGGRRRAVDQDNTTTMPLFFSSSDPAPARRPGGLFRTSSMSSLHNGRLHDTVPIVRHGTALVRGHEKKEVGAVCWTNQGHLVSVGDDFLVRCWREDSERAADLRTGGESEGRRWACGWADVGDDWDTDESCAI